MGRFGSMGIVGGFLATAVLSSAAAVEAQTTTGPAADVEAIAAIIDGVEAANNAGDVDAWVSYFAENAVYMPPGVPAVETRPALIDVARAGFAHHAEIDIQPIEIHVEGDWAFARSHVDGSVTLANGGDVIAIDTKQLVI